MQIERHGSERDRGIAGTGLSLGHVKWDTETKSIEITARSVHDFNTTSRHDWFINITLLELAAMLDAAAKAIGSADSSIVAEALKPSLTSILRLATECSSYVASSVPSKESSPSDAAA